MTYSTGRKIPANLVTIDADRAFEVMALNKQGVKPDDLSRDRKKRSVPQNMWISWSRKASHVSTNPKKEKEKTAAAA